MKETEIHQTLFEALKKFHLQYPHWNFTFNRNETDLQKGLWLARNHDYNPVLELESARSYLEKLQFQLIFHATQNSCICRVSQNFISDTRAATAEAVRIGFELSTTSDQCEKKYSLKSEKKASIVQTLEASVFKDIITIQNKHDSVSILLGTEDAFSTRAEIERIEWYQMKPSFEKTDLPCALSGLAVKNFQGIQDLEITNLPLKSSWIFLLGENGFGKTSILRAIAKGLVGDEDSVKVRLSPQNQIYVKGCYGKQFFQRISYQKNTLELPVATYGTGRFLVNNERVQSKSKTEPLFSDDYRLLNIEEVLVQTHRAKMENRIKNGAFTFDQLTQVLTAVIPNLQKIDVVYSEEALLPYKVCYYEQDLHKDMLQPVELNDLAAGYRNIITMIGDMLIRLNHQNRQKKIQDLEGIVLIDELDAHLHPQYLYDLPKLLSEQFPKVQFIASTHSPIPILGLPKSIQPVVLKVNRTLKTGITVERLDDDIEIQRLNIHSLLSSPLFNFPHILARDATPESIIPHNNYRDASESAKMNLLKQKMKALNLSPKR